MQTWFQDLIYEILLKTTFFFLPTALTRANFSLHFCQAENFSQVRRNNEQHYSDQRKEYEKCKVFPATHAA